MKNKIIVALLAVVMMLSLAGCSEGEKADENSKFYGTWTVAYYEQDGVKIAPDEVKSRHGENPSAVSLILKEDGTYILAGNGGITGNWSIAADGIDLDGIECTFDGDYINFSPLGDGNVIGFKKTSDSQK